MRKTLTIFLSAFIMLSCSDKSGQDSSFPYSEADFTVDSFLQSGMVIQRNAVFRISGTGTPGGAIQVSCSWESSPHEVTIDNSGEWSVPVDTPEADGSNLEITVEGRRRLVFSYILAGDVWLCAGQSNMYFPLKDSENGAQAVREASEWKIRLLDVEKSVSETEKEDFKGRWNMCTPESAAGFSAVGYWFGRTLLSETGVPVGLVGVNWGNTGIEVWTRRDDVMSEPDLADYVSVQESVPHADGSPERAGSAYNAMVAPLSVYPVRGVIWYQGENNQGMPYLYPAFFRIMVSCWRNLWQDDIPFYVAQICPYERVWDFSTNYSNPAMRYMQAVSAESVPGCAVEVNDDVADIHDIHPKKKKEVGQRLAWMALEQTYGMESFSRMRCPLYDGAVAGDGKMTVSFRYAEGGLSTSDGMAPSGFELAGDDRVFYPAEAEIEGSSVVLHSPDVPEPVFVRLGWSYTRTTNLRSASGLPVGVFRNYDWEEPEEER